MPAPNRALSHQDPFIQNRMNKSFLLDIGIYIPFLGELVKGPPSEHRIWLGRYSAP
jgi:hypothetical protein